MRRDLEKVDDLLDPRAMLDFLLERGAVAEELPEEAAVHLQRAPGHDVVERGHAAKQREILEGAGDAAVRRGIRPHRCVRTSPLKVMRPACGW